MTPLWVRTSAVRMHRSHRGAHQGLINSPTHSLHSHTLLFSLPLISQNFSKKFLKPSTEGVHGRSKLIFPSTIYRLCKEAGVSFREFRDTEFIPAEKPITARVMVRTMGRNINYEQHEEEEDEPQPIQQDENEAEHVYEDDNQEEQKDMHFEAPNADFQNTF
ncbi:hypothetical protein PIB30_054862 [Stylosanthes scabra]|uniref:Uncharacterized protein n=1 Tax=Stylosanthes scabra TaxID=79078 RepID=A0ABU6VKW6_9FABA|nr:hypothetical protein [Stylosanthes scabra]